MIQFIRLKYMHFEAAKVRNFQNLSNFAAQNRTRSLMDKIKDSGSLAQGSIPCGFTKKCRAVIVWQPYNHYFFSVIITSIAPTPNLAMLAMRFSVL